ncbi:haloalkane dehalogenase [Hoeflea prorocentri]|uniref:Haloalkane dehalogenase n=1 Tax=Hoeflea prorocentri TaxID=1922333 RepID=A0A9X3UL87_9HYPH|nr:haloalkane dehalogenase [Hoeflea prorocentri]MCY6382631.1 haloalkane dehalogenase [Hoeflea prorocentri]MDA5400431.1 haloalkane dehalogenase [Hoeflea prorocentri]
MKHSSRFLAAAAAATMIFIPLASAQEANPYADFKIPPAEVSSDFPYEHKFVEILGSRMAYVDEGDGDPILFLHGQPTSSYLWRNIMPFVEGKGRIIAPDNIGFGKSDQPDLDYTFLDHYRYFEAFVEELGLKDITLVVHDWGSGLGLHYAAEHPDNVKGIVTMEALIAPILPAVSYEAMPKELGGFFSFVRSPEGRKLIVEGNGWLTGDGFLTGFTDRPLADEALRTYQAPHTTEKSRVQVNQWPNEIPIGGEPATTTQIIGNYNAFLEKTDIPWLFLYASPGATAPEAAADYWAERAKNIETVYIGHGLHYVQEDQPYAIGRAIADWYRRLDGN